MEVEFHLLSAGYCVADKSHALAGVECEEIRFHATYGHIIHPEHGHILFDTGYTRRFHELTARWPYSLYAKMTPVSIERGEEAVHKLGENGISPESVNMIIISHFHADHIGGLKDFPNAKLICNRRAYEAVEGKRGFAAVRRGFLPDLLPPDFEERVQFVDFEDSHREDPYLGRLVDLLGDGTVQLCELSGHAAGQIGALLKTDAKPVFLVADAAWLHQNYKEMHLPSGLVRLFFDSWGDFKRSLHRVHLYHLAHPEVVIVPCHGGQPL